MAYSLVASTEKAGDGTTPAIDTTGASLLVIMVSCTAASAPAPTDSKGNTWVSLTARSGNFDSTNRLYYVANPTVGSGHTFSIDHPSDDDSSICVAAFAGAAAAPFDQQNGANEPASQPGSVTPSEDDELIVTGVGGLPQSFSVNSGFTIDESIALSPGVNWGCAIAHLIQGTAAAVNPTWTFGGGSTAAVVIATFKAAAGGGAVANRRRRVLLCGAT